MSELEKASRALEEMGAGSGILTDGAVAPALDAAKATLVKTGIPEEAVESHFCPQGSAESLVSHIVEEARDNNCDTIVVGRGHFPWRKEIGHHHVADELILKSRGLTLWIVE